MKKMILGLCLLVPLKLLAAESFYAEQVKPGLERAIDSSSLYLLLSGAGAVAVTRPQDDDLHDRWKNQQVWSKNTSNLGDDYGKYAIGAFAALGQTYFDPENGKNHIRALVGNAIVTTTMKLSFKRERPDQSNHLSFPSGHTSDAFTTATSLTYAYGWKAGIVAYPIATFVAFSRLADEAHWLSDITAGAFVGVWMGRSFFYPKGEDASSLNSKDGVHFQAIPVLSSRYSGFNLALDF